MFARILTAVLAMGTFGGVIFTSPSAATFDFAK
jgi:hypothetical protein